MNYMKYAFVAIMTTIIVLGSYLVADIMIMGLIALIISIFNEIEAIQVFKYGVLILFLVEASITISVAIKSYKKGDDKSGS